MREWFMHTNCCVKATESAATQNETRRNNGFHRGFVIII